MNLFVFEKTKEFMLPSSYDRYETMVTGAFTTDSVRFYKEALEKKVTFESIQKKNPEKTNEEIRNALRKFSRILESFRVSESGIVEMKVDGTDHKRKFKFSKGMILVKGENFIDVTNKELLSDYLSNYGFDEKYAKAILKNDITTLHRNPSKKLTYNFE